MARKTSRKRFVRSLKAIADWCRRNRHEPMRVQVEKLGLKLKGHYGYYGITGNFRQLAKFRQAVIRVWRYWLNRRDRSDAVTWERMHHLLNFWYIPPPRVVHSAFANP